MADLSALTAAVEAGNRAEAVSLTQAAVDEGVGPDEILEAMTTAMTEVGRKSWREALLRTLSVPEVRSSGLMVGLSNLSSLEPERIGPELAEALADPRIRPHFHVPVQSGSDEVLGRMRRR